MKNKEITMYELMGLIKDGKAPYEIIYKNSKYFMDELEEYYKREDGTPLFEHIFDNYNDYDSLQERVEVLSGENDEWEDIELLMCLDTRETSDCICKIQDKINQFIKNQKYIIEKLESKDVL